MMSTPAFSHTNFSSLHPSVLEKFEIPYPVSTLELNLEVFL